MIMHVPLDFAINVSVVRINYLPAAFDIPVTFTTVFGERRKQEEAGERTG